jgi:hypothetical protein
MPPSPTSGDYWTSPRVSRSNGQKLAVGYNCRCALSQVMQGCSGFELAHFWMDFICINQNDVDEKASQVRMMGDIFVSAQLVFLCIGNLDENSEFVISVLSQCGEYRRSLEGVLPRFEVWAEAKEYLEENARGSSGQPFSSQDTDPIDMFGSGFLRLANRVYWRRLWILQELWLSRDALLLCGDSTFPIVDAAILLEFCQASSSPWLQSVWWQNLAMLSTLGGSRFLPLKDTRMEQNRSHFWDILERADRLRCSDPKDR